MDPFEYLDRFVNGETSIDDKETIPGDVMEKSKDSKYKVVEHYKGVYSTHWDFDDPFAANQFINKQEVDAEPGVEYFIERDTGEII